MLPYWLNVYMTLPSPFGSDAFVLIESTLKLDPFWIIRAPKQRNCDLPKIVPVLGTSKWVVIVPYALYVIVL